MRSTTKPKKPQNTTKQPDPRLAQTIRHNSLPHGAHTSTPINHTDNHTDKPHQTQRWGGSGTALARTADTAAARHGPGGDRARREGHRGHPPGVSTYRWRCPCCRPARAMTPRRGRWAAEGAAGWLFDPARTLWERRRARWAHPLCEDVLEASWERLAAAAARAAGGDARPGSPRPPPVTAPFPGVTPPELRFPGIDRKN